MIRQRALKSITRAIGVGVHSGQKVELTLRPAPPDAGISFRRVDLPVPVDIAVNALAVSDTRMASTISADGDPGAPKVQTRAASTMRSQEPAGPPGRRAAERANSGRRSLKVHL